MRESNIYTTRDIFHRVYIDTCSYISLFFDAIQQDSPNATIGFMPTKKNRTKETKNADNDASLSKSTLNPQF